MNNLKLPGILLFLAGSIALLGIITAEALYPSGSGCTTFSSEISDLGATKPPNSLIYQPSAGIFNTTMLLSGLMTLTATFFQHKHFKKLLFSIPFGLFGLSLAGVGFFSGEKVPYHGIFALLTFISGGVSAITSAKLFQLHSNISGFYSAQLHWQRGLPPCLSPALFFLLSALAERRDGWFIPSCYG